MLARSLADFLEELGNAGELARVDAEVDPVLEIAEITRQIPPEDGTALLFGSTRGHEVPVVTNLLGSRLRIARAAGEATLEAVAERMALLCGPAQSSRRFEMLPRGPLSGSGAAMAPRQVRSAACQQIVRLGKDVDLGRLPALRSGDEETLSAVTAGIVFAADPDSHRAVMGRYDLQVAEPQRLLGYWCPHEPLAQLAAEYARRGEKMPLAVVLGGEPVLLLAAMAPIAAADRVGMASLLRQKPLDVIPCRTVDLQVPAEADFVLEGYTEPNEQPEEAGPLCAATGYYAAVRPLPVIHITAITHRANPVFPALVPAGPPNEMTVIQQALIEVFLPLLGLAIDGLVDYHLPSFGAARHGAVVSIRKTYAGQARRVAQAVWGSPLLMPPKLLVVVDQQVDVRDTRQVLAAVAANVRPQRDVFLGLGPPDPFDPATPPGELGSMMGIDATEKLPGEQAGRLPRRASTGQTIQQLVSERWEQYGLGPPPSAERPP